MVHGGIYVRAGDEQLLYDLHAITGRGQVKSRMLPIAFDGPPPSVGAEVLAGDLRAGVVTSVGAGRAIALLRLDRAEGQALSVDGRAVRLERPAWFREALGEDA